MAEATGIDASIAAAEAAKSSEKRVELKTRDSRGDVVDTFKFAYSQLENQPDDSLTPELQWLKNKALRNAKEQTIDQNRDFLDVRFENHHTGEAFVQQEGIPVDKLIEFLREKAKNLPRGSEERKKLQEATKILYRNSRLYRRLPHRMEPDRLVGRVHHEAKLVSLDSDRATGDTNRDWYAAEKDLMNRRELIFPPIKTLVATGPSVTTPEVGGAPATTAEVTTDTPPATPTETDRPDTTNTPSVESVRREFAIINRSVDVRKRARELAEEQLRNEMRRGSAWNPRHWPRKIALRVAEEFYRQRFVERATRAMIDHNNSYLDMDVVNSALRDVNHRLTEERSAGQAKVEQVKTQVSEGISLEGQRLGQEIQEAQGTLKDTIIRDVLRPVIEGRITDQAQIQDALRRFVQNNQTDAQVQAIFGRNATQFGNLADYFASDLLEMGKQVKQDLEAHKYAIEQLNDVIKIQLGNTSWAAETESKLNNTTDRVVAWAERNRLRGLLVNPATIGAAMSIATYGFQRVTGVASGAANFIAPGVGLLAGAGFAAMRRNYDLKIDRASHQVERTYNSQIGPNSPRREALERFQYNTASANDLLLNLRNTQRLDLSVSQQTNRETVARAIAEVKARLDFSAREKIDLITYTEREQVEQGRLELIRTVIESRKALRDHGMSNDEIAQLENRFTAEWNQQFTQNREQQDRAFARYRLRNSLGAGVFGGAVGLALGLLVQEGVALSQRGAGMNVGQTAIERGLALLGIGGQETQPATPGGFHSEATRELFRNPGNLKINDHVTLAASPNILEGNVRGVTMLVDGQSTGPTMFLTEQGTIVSSGNIDNIPTGPLKETLGELTNQEILNPNVNSYQEVQNYLTTGEHKTFIRGDFIFDLNSGPDGQMSFQHYPTQTGVHGFAQLDDGKPIIEIDQQFNGNKNLQPQDWETVRNELTKDGWEVKMDQIEGAKSVLGPEGEWAKHTTEVKRQWYAYNTPWSEKNELMQYSLDKKGSIVSLDMSKMGVSSQRGLSPENLNVQEVIKSGKGGWAFSLPGQESHPIIVLDSDDGIIDGKITLNPNDTDPSHVINTPGGPVQLGEFSKIILNEQKLASLPDGDIATEYYTNIKGEYRLDVWRLNGGQEGKFGTISAGRLIDGANGEKIWQSFATIRGAGATPPEIGGPRDVLHLVPPTATEFVPPAPPTVESYDAPIIPIPFAPRHPLEKLRSRGDYYLGAPSSEERRAYAGRRSPRLNANPDAVLDPHEEAQWYYEQQPVEYRQEMEALNSSIEEEMDNNCRVAICIPIASHQEGENIYNTLMQYTDQRDRNGNTIDSNLFEIILFLNRPQNSTPDTTAAEIERFMADHPEIKIRTVEKIFPERPNMGVISKYVTDLAIFRNLKRNAPTNQDLIIAANDADADLISKRYINEIINEYDDQNNKKVEGALGKIEWNPEAFIRFPGFHAANRFYQFIEATKRHASGYSRNVGSSGANFTFKSSIYSAIGGFDTSTDLAQDVQLGRMIRAARRDDPNSIDYINGAWVVTNPRRGVDAYQKGIPVVEQWSDWADNQTSIRIKNWRSNPVAKEDIDHLNIQHLQNDINATLAVYRVTANSETARKALSLLGLLSKEEIQQRIDNLHAKGATANSPEIQQLLNNLGLAATNFHIEGDKIVVDQGSYQIENGRIFLNNITRLQNNLKAYRNTNRDKINLRKNEAITGIPAADLPPRPPKANMASRIIKKVRQKISRP